MMLLNEHAVVTSSSTFGLQSPQHFDRTRPRLTASLSSVSTDHMATTTVPLIGRLYNCTTQCHLKVTQGHALRDHRKAHEQFVSPYIDDHCTSDRRRREKAIEVDKASWRRMDS